MKCPDFKIWALILSVEALGLAINYAHLIYALGRLQPGTSHVQINEHTFSALSREL